MKRLTLLLLALFFGAFLLWPPAGLLGNAFFVADSHGVRHFTLRFFALLETYNVGGWWSRLNPRNNPVCLLVVGYALRRPPYVVPAAHAGYEQSSVTLEEASLTLGAGRWRTFSRITLPLLAPVLQPAWC